MSTETYMQDLLLAVLQLDDAAMEELADEIIDTRSFEDAGLLTMNKGIVVSMRCGSQFQITVVQSN